MSTLERDRQYIQSLQIELELCKRANPFSGSDVSKEIAEKRARINWFTSCRDELLQLVKAHGGERDFDAAVILWNSNTVGSMELEEALPYFKEQLVHQGLVDPAHARGIDVYFQDPGIKERRQAAANQFQKLQDAKVLILRAVGGRGEIDALNLYNSELDTQLNWEKIERWCSALVSAGLLGKEWLMGYKPGSVLFKMIDGMWSNKMLPPRENK